MLDPQLANAERDPELARAIGRLPPRRRLIFVLRYLADLPYGEIAAVCGVSEGTVAAALSAARDQLRSELDDPSSPHIAATSVKGVSGG